MAERYRMVQLEEGVLVEIISEDPGEDAGRFFELLQKLAKEKEAQVPIMRTENGEAVLAVGEDKVVPLPREVLKTLYKKPVLAVAFGNDVIGEEVARFNLVPEVILRELL